MSAASTRSIQQVSVVNRYCFPNERSGRRSSSRRTGRFLVLVAIAVAGTAFASWRVTRPAAVPDVGRGSSPAVATRVTHASATATASPAEVSVELPSARTLPAVSDRRQVYLQVAAAYGGDRFDALLTRLSRLGFEASAVQASDGLTRVVVGPYTDRDQAQASASELRRAGFDPFPREFAAAERKNRGR